MIKTSDIKRIGLDIGFDLVTTTHLDKSEYAEHVQKWVDEDRYGSMQWYPKNIDRRLDPQQHLHGQAVSAITVGLYYRSVELDPKILNDPSRGIISRYALYQDYHKVMEKMLKDFAKKLEADIGGEWHYHVYVDTGPLLEREIGEKGDAGFIGKNTTLINQTLGSYFFLGEIICDLDIEVDTYLRQGYGGHENHPALHSRFGEDKPVEGSCGSCTRCQIACPTNAFVSPYILDARKCISYLTIENCSEIPVEFRKMMQNRIYGCDICQEVCPWNKKVPAEYKSILQPKVDQAPYLLDLISLDEEGFKKQYKDTPIPRAKRTGFIRNVLVAIGNWGDLSAFQPVQALLSDSESLVRQHAVWALYQIDQKQALPFINKLKLEETNEQVLSEIERLISSTI